MCAPELAVEAQQKGVVRRCCRKIGMPARGELKPLAAAVSRFMMRESVMPGSELHDQPVYAWSLHLDLTEQSA